MDLHLNLCLSVVLTVPHFYMSHSVLRIHVILMRIRILNPHWKKIYPDAGHFFKIYWIFFYQKIIFNFYCFIFFVNFYPKTWWPIQKWGNFYCFIFFKSSGLGFMSEKVFFSVFCWFFTLGSGSVDPHIFAKILRIRILSTGLNDQIFLKTNPDTFVSPTIWRFVLSLLSLIL